MTCIWICSAVIDVIYIFMMLYLHILFWVQSSEVEWKSQNYRDWSFWMKHAPYASLVHLIGDFIGYRNKGIIGMWSPLIWPNWWFKDRHSDGLVLPYLHCSVLLASQLTHWFTTKPCRQRLGSSVRPISVMCKGDWVFYWVLSAMISYFSLYQ
jgi:hypothetical protein